MNLARAQKFVDSLCEMRGIDSVCVVHPDHPQLMWSCMAYDPRDQTILVGMIDLTRPDEDLKAMLAHELAHHIQHARASHRLRVKIIPALACIVFMLPGWLPAALADPATLVALLPGSIIASWLLARFIALPLVHQREELICDRLGWQMTGDALAAADTLACDNDDKAWRPWNSHPPTSVRVRRARQAHGQMAAA